VKKRILVIQSEEEGGQKQIPKARAKENRRHEGTVFASRDRECSWLSGRAETCRRQGHRDCRKRGNLEHTINTRRKRMQAYGTARKAGRVARQRGRR